MSYEWVSELALKSIAEDRARIILKFLDERDIAVSDSDRNRIESCRDLEMLDAWVMRAPSVQRVEELY